MISRDEIEKLLKAKAPVWGPELNSEWTVADSAERGLLRRAPDWAVYALALVAVGLLIYIVIL